MPTTTTKIKACPFCGSTNITSERLLGEAVYGMKCDNCDARGPQNWDHFTDEHVIQLWNKRGRKQWTI